MNLCQHPLAKALFLQGFSLPVLLLERKSSGRMEFSAEHPAALDALGCS